MQFCLVTFKHKVMKKEILHIENTNSSEFISKIHRMITQLQKNFEATYNNDDILLSREEAAKMLSISTVTLWKLTKNDIIPAFKIGSKVRYKKSDILASLEKMNNFH